MPNGIQCLRYLLTLHIPTLLFCPWGDRCFAPNCSGCLHSRTSARWAGYHEVEVKGANWVHQAFRPRMLSLQLENGKWERNSFGQPFCLTNIRVWKVLKSAVSWERGELRRWLLLPIGSMRSLGAIDDVKDLSADGSKVLGCSHKAGCLRVSSDSAMQQLIPNHSTNIEMWCDMMCYICKETFQNARCLGTCPS